MNIEIMMSGGYEPLLLEKYFNVTQVFRSRYVHAGERRVIDLSFDDGAVGKTDFSLREGTLRINPVFHI